VNRGANAGTATLVPDAMARHGGGVAIKGNRRVRKDKATFLDWLGLRREPDFSRLRGLGGLICVAVIVFLVITVGAIAIQFFEAATGLGAFGDAEARSTVIRNIGLVLAAVVGLPFLIWRSVVAQKQVDVAEQGLFNDKINAAANDLHARRLVTMNPDERENRWDYWQDDIVKRNAAIDRLEGLVRENPETAERISRLLCIYLRELSAENKPQEVPQAATPKELRNWAGSLAQHSRSDMQNAAQVLGRLAQIDGVDPDKVEIDLRGANLQGFDLRGAVFNKARLMGALMQGADLGVAQMQGADLRGALMQGADLSRAKMQGADLGVAQMQGADLFGAQMQGADLFGAKMQGAVLGGAQMQGAFLFGAKMQGADLSRAQMQGANLSGAQIQGAVLGGAQMQGADLSRAKMQGADLSRAQMQGADLRGAQMDAATSLRAANLAGAALSEVDYSDVAINQAQVDEVFYDGSVRFALGINPAPGRDAVLEWQEFRDEWRAWQKERGFDPGKHGA
jgi:uncharacterized protein YjbI with pentapeptide repeats